MKKQSDRIIALLGPTNTGKTYVAIEKMLKYETGIFGLSFILLVIVGGFIYRIDSSSQEQITRKQISQAFFVLIVLVLVRQGNYMLNGLPLVFLLYYYNSVQYKDLIIEKYNT